ncbi:hypothetical protein BC939DRAFT_480223 [Gamsiella multidivaricata]|uniref:uncharacterized protein n=1 Tax=Gamsiella multidivaricata TaxID=101098 RepID=UPI0022200947|nr:uncharacterized protein BC939DRAFT_480223 [Gamsiella multidivaricata]KAG0364985.1 hypothetical protein BGZ54_006967 [Gamsiella multidivaricata]KAI7818669.1 hypothetical protein BC939DRAFT_480223 [Gamsiella multidivaricata]
MPMLKEGLKKLYFPSTVLKLVRNGPNIPAVSNTLTFRVPPSMNKFDIKSYLSNIYKLNVLTVRTANMPAKLAGSGGNTILKRQKFKKAVVTIDQEFKWPDAPDSAAFGIQDAVNERSRMLNRLKGWRMRPSHSVQAAKKAGEAEASTGTDVKA